MEESKKWYTSKTLWINSIAIIGIIVQSHTGFIISAEDQASILGVINLFLRIITSLPLGR
jgi:hypothetical protein